MPKKIHRPTSQLVYIHTYIHTHAARRTLNAELLTVDNVMYQARLTTKKIIEIECIDPCFCWFFVFFDADAGLHILSLE